VFIWLRVPILAHNRVKVNGVATCLAMDSYLADSLFPMTLKLCYNLNAMWLGVQVSAYLSILVAYALLLVLAVRHRIERRRAQKLLETALFLAALWTVALGLLALLAPRGWWAFIWHRTAQVGLVLLALLTAEFADSFVERKGQLWLRRALVSVLFLFALVLDVQPIPWPLDVWLFAFVRLGSTELATALLIGAWAISTGTAWWTGIYALSQATGSKHRNRIRYLQAALLSFTVGDLLIFIGGIPDVYVGLASRLLGFSILTFAILRYDLPDLRRVGLVVLRVIVMAALTAIVYLSFLFVAGFITGGIAVLERLEVAAPAVIA
jgi:hypothetical protein